MGDDDGEILRRNKENTPETGTWLLTYSDMVTLLLTFLSSYSPFLP